MIYDICMVYDNIYDRYNIQYYIIYNVWYVIYNIQYIYIYNITISYDN